MTNFIRLSLILLFRLSLWCLVTASFQSNNILAYFAIRLQRRSKKKNKFVPKQGPYADMAVVCTTIVIELCAFIYSLLGFVHFAISHCAAQLCAARKKNKQNDPQLNHM